jgi:outer membrane protein TolC
VGRFPRTISRNSSVFIYLKPDSIHSGIPSQLLQNRPDIRQAELDLEAAKLDVKVAKTYFYPTLNISAIVGLEAFNPTYLVSKPESTMYNLAAGLVGPLVNRNAIKAIYYSANSKQIQAAFNYERTILRAYLEVSNQLSNIANLKRSYDLKDKQVVTLTESIDLANLLFRSARADYMEVLLTQRDAMESRFELVETKKLQLNAMVNIYQALGGGWK